MSDEEAWNDAAREQLRETLRASILGELRLKRQDDEGILESCREIYIEDEAPEDEWERFMQFAREEILRSSAKLLSERANWPAPTDCDRLDLVEDALRERGIVFWQASPCCDTCTHGELPERIELLNDRDPGFSDRLRGYAFFIDQNLPEMLSESTELMVYLAYGWYSPDGEGVPEADYEQHALGIAQEVCDSLRAEGFEPDWDGDFSRKIGIQLNWLRRGLLR